ncbi:6407_t:CDS:2, partial [Dentiscutata heterogama]
MFLQNAFAKRFFFLPGPIMVFLQNAPICTFPPFDSKLLLGRLGEVHLQSLFSLLSQMVFLQSMPANTFPPVQILSPEGFDILEIRRNQCVVLTRSFASFPLPDPNVVFTNGALASVSKGVFLLRIQGREIDKITVLLQNAFRVLSSSDPRLLPTKFRRSTFSPVNIILSSDVSLFPAIQRQCDVLAQRTKKSVMFLQKYIYKAFLPSDLGLIPERPYGVLARRIRMPSSLLTELFTG